MGRIVEILGYLLIAVYVFFTILIFANKFSERIKKFEKFKYLVTLLLLLLMEMTIVSSALPDLD